MPPPAPVDWINLLRLARKYHCEEKFYNLSVLRQIACPPHLSPSPLLLPSLPLPSLLPTTIVAATIALYAAVTVAVACLPQLLPSPLLLQSTCPQSLSPSPLLCRPPLFVACHPHCRHNCPCPSRACPFHCLPATLPLLLLSPSPSPSSPSLSHHRCRHQPRCCCSPATLNAIAITLATIAIALFVAQHPHRCGHCPLHCLCCCLPATLVTIAIPLFAAPAIHDDCHCTVAAILPSIAPPPLMPIRILPLLLLSPIVTPAIANCCHCCPLLLLEFIHECEGDTDASGDASSLLGFIQLAYCRTGVLAYCCTGVLAYWHTGVLAYWPYWHTGILAYCCTGVLAYCHIGVLAYWHTVILAYCRTGVLAYCRTGVLAYWHTVILALKTCKSKISVSKLPCLSTP
jgi:hypothetical protein